MDRYAIYAAISHMDNVDVDPYSICELLSATLADIAEKISNDEMRRLLLIGGYLFNQGQKELDQELDTGFVIDKPHGFLQ